MIDFLFAFGIACVALSDLSTYLSGLAFGPPREFAGCFEGGLGCHVRATLAAMPAESALAAGYRALDPSSVMDQLVQDARSRMLLNTESPTADASFFAALLDSDRGSRGLRAPDQCAPGAGDALALWGHGPACDVIEAQLIEFLHPRPVDPDELRQRAAAWVSYPLEGAQSAAGWVDQAWSASSMDDVVRAFEWVDQNTVDMREAAGMAVLDGASNLLSYTSGYFALTEVPANGRLAKLTSSLFDLECTCRSRLKVSFRSLWEMFIWPPSPPQPPPKKMFLKRGLKAVVGVFRKKKERNGSCSADAPKPSFWAKFRKAKKPPPEQSQPQKFFSGMKEKLADWKIRKKQQPSELVTHGKDDASSSPSSPPPSFWKKLFPSRRRQEKPGKQQEPSSWKKLLRPRRQQEQPLTQQKESFWKNLFRSRRRQEQDQPQRVQQPEGQQEQLGEEGKQQLSEPPPPSSKESAWKKVRRKFQRKKNAPP